MAASIFAKTATATGDLHTGRTRLKAFYVKTASDDTQVTIPDHGIIFEDDCHVTLTNITSITGFFG